MKDAENLNLDSVEKEDFDSPKNLIILAGTTEEEDFDSLRSLIVLGGKPEELIIPYLEGINLQKNRLEKLKKYIQEQKPDKKNKFLLDLIEKLS